MGSVFVFFVKICQFSFRRYRYIPISHVRVRTNGEKQSIKTKPKTNEQPFLSLRGKRGWRQTTQDTRDRQKLNQESTVEVTDALSSWVRDGRRPALKKKGRVPNRFADHTLRLQGRRHRETGDLRWTKYGCCSNSIITSYNKRFVNVPQRSIR